MVGRLNVATSFLLVMAELKINAAYSDVLSTTTRPIESIDSFSKLLSRWVTSKHVCSGKDERATDASNSADSLTVFNTILALANAFPNFGLIRLLCSVLEDKSRYSHTNERGNASDDKNIQREVYILVVDDEEMVDM